MRRRRAPGRDAPPLVPGASRPELSEADERLYGPFRDAVLGDLGTDFRLGFKLAYLWSFASPVVAGALDATGEIRQRPVRRAKDTSIVVYEILASGPGSERAQHMVDLLQRVHRRVPGGPDDHLFVLSTLFVAPVRLVDRAGRRPLTGVERAAAGRFFGRLADDLGLEGAPRSQQEAEAFLDRYVASSVAPSPAAARLTASTIDALVASVRPALRPVARAVARTTFAALLDAPAASGALGLPRVPRPVRSLLLGARRALRRRAAPDGVAFTPGEPSRVHPKGYDLADVGPEQHRAGGTAPGGRASGGRA